MCDTMQTWKWGGFGLGRRRWGETEDSRQTGALRCRGCAALEAALCRGHQRLTPPLWGAIAEAVMVARLPVPLPG